jgi:uncharacterized protein
VDEKARLLREVPIFNTAEGKWTAPFKSKDEKTKDGFVNFQAKLGIGPGRGSVGQGGDNLLSAGHYDFNLVTRNRIQLEAAYRGSWIVGQVIDTIAEDMTRAGVHVTTDKEADAVSDFKAYQTHMQIWQSLRENTQWARLYGGAVAVMQIDGQRLNTPLSIDSVTKGQFKGLTVYDRWQIWPVLTSLIVSGPNMGLPAYYDIVLGTNLNDPGMEPGGQRTDEASGRVRVHHSRCIRMDGVKLPFFQAITEMLWGESVLERMWDRLIAFDDATMNMAGLVHRALLRTIGVDGLREILAAGGKAQEALVAQFDLIREMQSNEGLTLLDKNDSFASAPYTFAGLSDVILQLAQQVSGACNPAIPLIRLFGQAPTGLNSDGSGDIRLYYDGVNAKQEAMYRNPLTTLFKVMWRSFRGKPMPKDFNFTFVPLWQMDAKDKADIGKTVTDTLTEAHQSGAISTAVMMKELKQHSVETGLYTHISDEDIEEAENDPPPMPGEQEPGADPEAEASGEEGKPPEPGKKATDSKWNKFKAWVSGKPAKTDDSWNVTLGAALINEGLSGLREKREAREAVAKKKKGRDEAVSDARKIKDFLGFKLYRGAEGMKQFKKDYPTYKDEAVSDASTFAPSMALAAALIARSAHLGVKRAKERKTDDGLLDNLDIPKSILLSTGLWAATEVAKAGIKRVGASKNKDEAVSDAAYIKDYLGRLLNGQLKYGVIPKRSKDAATKYECKECDKEFSSTSTKPRCPGCSSFNVRKM